ncbi:MAG: fructosamine kinase family protein [Actinomycetota bacterium]
MAALDDRLADLLGSEVRRASRVTGGDVSDARRVELADGRVVFAKTHAAPPAGFFTTEAAGLDWLRDADSVAVPEVLAVSDEPPAVLVLAWIDEGVRVAATEAELGRSLAGLHRSGATAFGREDRRTTGSLALPNDPCATWAEFFAERRLRPLARIAADRAALDPSAIDGIEAIADRLDLVGGPAEPPARLHGDLWAGNRLVDAAGRNWLIDPAAHGGHREFDLAMMRLFGGYGDACFAAYDEHHPLADGWEERVELHQLAPLVVHAIKFGHAYVPAVRAAVVRHR